MPLPKVYDWERFRLALKQLHDTFPGFLQSVVLVGGGAAWFYRETLRQWRDSEFPVPDWTAAEQNEWLSRDVDFMGLDVAEAADLLQTPFDETTHTFHFAGLEVDFLDEGLQLVANSALQTARLVQLPDFNFNVVEASLLFAEKSALLRAKDRPQDRLHRQLLVEFLKCEFCRQAEHPASLRSSRWVARARSVKTTDAGFFENDLRLTRRLTAAILAVKADEHRALKHWAKHHLPGYTQ
jgi:hypothetical protein